MAYLTLYSDAKAKYKRFAVCDKNGEPVWHGIMFDDDYDFNGEQSTGEMSAAKKAVFVAKKVKEALGLDEIHLTLKVDAEWLTWANCEDPKKGGKAKNLKYAAEKAGVNLTVEHIPGISNPADKYTLKGMGFKKYQDNDLASLIDEVGVA